jgi:hypothetical protein
MFLWKQRSRLPRLLEGNGRGWPRRQQRRLLVGFLFRGNQFIDLHLLRW